MERAKRRYEEETDTQEDWGGFLSKAVIIGLVALGICKLVKYQREHPLTICPLCGKEFPLPFAEDLPRISYVYCPHCGDQLVIDYGNEQSHE